MIRWWWWWHDDACAGRGGWGRILIDSFKLFLQFCHFPCGQRQAIEAMAGKARVLEAVFRELELNIVHDVEVERVQLCLDVRAFIQDNMRFNIEQGTQEIGAGNHGAGVEGELWNTRVVGVGGNAGEGFQALCQAPVLLQSTWLAACEERQRTQTNHQHHDSC